MWLTATLTHFYIRGILSRHRQTLQPSVNCAGIPLSWWEILSRLRVGGFSFSSPLNSPCLSLSPASVWVNGWQTVPFVRGTPRKAAGIGHAPEWLWPCWQVVTLSYASRLCTRQLGMWSRVEIQTWGKLAETGNKAVRLNASLGVGIVRGAVPAPGTPACNCWAKR